MIQKTLDSVPLQKVTMAGAENVQMQILCGPDDGCPNFAMRRFVVAPGGCTPKHQHDYEHEVLVLAGRGMAYGNGSEHALKAGDVFFVPANELHQFRNTADRPLEFICLVPAFVHRGGGAWHAGPQGGGLRHMNPETPHAALIQPAAFTAFLHSEIPLTRAMGMTVAAWDGRTVTLTAPLEPNQNHSDTGFGGAISTMGIMAGYSLLHLLLEERKISNRLLIQKSATDYLRPIDADFTATACLPEPAVLAEFLETLQRRRRARLSLPSQVHCNRLLAASHTGLYVAMLY